MSFQEFNFAPAILRGIEASGFSAPTEIQRQALPVALAGSDLLASAQTGTGKTAAFVLPALQALLKPARVQGRGPRVLVLTPTRELAVQVTEAIRTLGRFTPLRAGAVVGGVPYPPQLRLLQNPLDLLVATPGRLLDHMERGRVDFSRLELLVLDEADRMLDMGFAEDVERIVAACPAQRQTLLFSATLEGDILRIAAKLLKDPVRIQVAGVKTRHEAIQQRVYQADNPGHKQRLLARLLDNPELSQVLVFTATKRGADELAAQVKDLGHQSAALHGDMRQAARQRTVERMRHGRLRVLVATDVAARGLDIKGISHVINFDLPKVGEDYVHRIGRTGRAGATGTALSLVSPQDWGNLVRIERTTGQRLERDVIEGLEPKHPEPRAERKPHNSRPYRADSHSYRSRPGADQRPSGRYKGKDRAPGYGR